jgi:hypothetical protein
VFPGHAENLETALLAATGILSIPEPGFGISHVLKENDVRSHPQSAVSPFGLPRRCVCFHGWDTMKSVRYGIDTYR